jgi:hypothetical protein
MHACFRFFVEVKSPCICKCRRLFYCNQGPKYWKILPPPPPGGQGISAKVICGKKYEKAMRKRGKIYKKRNKGERKKKKGNKMRKGK